jgi:hypothetical protein
MGALLARRVICLALLLFTASFATACSPVYTIARDLIESSREQHQGANSSTPRYWSAEPSLNRRFRPALESVLPHTAIGYARCPGLPDLGGVEVLHCTITAGTMTLPILAQYDPADRHINSTLALSVMRRRTLERNVAQRIKAAYGVAAHVSCPGPAVRFSIPDSTIACNVQGGRMARKVNVFIIDSGNWLSLEALPLPPGERELRAAFATHGGRDIPGPLVRRILFQRRSAFGAGPALDSVKCPRFMNLSDERREYCDLKFGSNDVLERVAFVHDRLAFRIGGALVPLEIINHMAADLSRNLHRNGERVSIDCHKQNFVFVPPSGYHWCEISAPAGYPKRLVITAMDAEGHYDMFFSN